MKDLASGGVGILHERLVFNRRIDVLSTWFARLAPQGIRILDVGCGDGLVSAALKSKRPDLSIQGIDVLPRDATHIPVAMFDGTRIPYEDSSFDLVLFSDVLHHTDDPAILLREARRVANQGVLIKDHYRKGLASGWRLRFMDWVGNARFGVALPYNYWTESQWKKSWAEIGLRPQQLVTQLGLYPPPVNWVFGARLHFIALLEQCKPE
ncbi:MAG TPA: class I SAM-dependent methyltransferase [Terriglobales bacterium]|nr:class I SAM-dependent methyltransferase [Terriglobales bacterium]